MIPQQEMAIDTMGDWKRSHDCGDLRAIHEGQEAILMGWVNARRDLGGLIFIDLRDREGMTQVVFDPQVEPQCHEKAKVLRNEWVLAVRGTVCRRIDGQQNPSLATGEIEIRATALKILNETQTPPFQVDGAVDGSETLRLRYRYLELRRPQVFHVFRTRHRMASCIRRVLDSEGFVDVETPFLTRSTPEGARDYLVPSRVNKGLFYALPQSPQLFKQLLMVAGFDRYYQIVRCFRDEDLRADRQPEFTQVDLEMSFVDEEGVMGIAEGMMKTLLHEAFDRDLPLPIPRITYAQAVERFGTDRPDIRCGLEIKDISDIAGRSEFRLFQEVIREGGVVKALCVEGGGTTFSRKALDELAPVVKEGGAKGLSWIKVTDGGWQSSLSKFFAEEDQIRLNQRLESRPGDLILGVADKPAVVCQALGTLRLHLAKLLGLMDDKALGFVWVTQFPLVEYSEIEGRLTAVHHPFTGPMEEDLPLLEENPLKVRARAYDLVLNGSEIGGGSIRIHSPILQQRVFRVLGITEEEARKKFGFLLDALKHGAPPHGGMAFGFDRLVAILCGLKSIRETIAFPKTTRATCLLTEAPSPVADLQLKELGLRLDVVT